LPPIRAFHCAAQFCCWRGAVCDLYYALYFCRGDSDLPLHHYHSFAPGSSPLNGALYRDLPLSLCHYTTHYLLRFCALHTAICNPSLCVPPYHGCLQVLVCGVLLCAGRATTFMLGKQHFERHAVLACLPFTYLPGALPGCACCAFSVIVCFPFLRGDGFAVVPLTFCFLVPARTRRWDRHDLRVSL